MNTIRRIIPFVCALELFLMFGSLVAFCHNPSLFGFLLFVCAVYLFPIFLFRLHNFLFPLQEGLSRLDLPKYSPWMGSHYIQLPYIALPFLEAILRLLPGVYSAWLRLWGSKIGKNVYWTPCIDITDRSLLKIGHRVIIGHKAGFYSHIITPKEQKLLLYVHKINIGPRAFIGGGCCLGPGVQVGKEHFLPAGTLLKPNQCSESKE